MSYELTTRTWLSLLRNCIGMPAISPRGIKCREMLYKQSTWEMDNPIVMLKERKLNMGFMFAEAYWILDGSNLLSDLTPYCEEIAKFSDDGKTMSGAYGPHFVGQLAYVVDVLARDPSTRQAIATLWLKAPAPSKDIPCTISLHFLLRNNRLDLSVYMRSSDVWLGLPYDIFCFSMMAWRVLLELQETRTISKQVQIGRLILNTGSQHLYETNVDRAKECLSADINWNKIRMNRPISLYNFSGPVSLMSWLRDNRNHPLVEV